MVNDHLISNSYLLNTSLIDSLEKKLVIIIIYLIQSWTKGIAVPKHMYNACSLCVVFVDSVGRDM